ncbi:small integral membrane protein 20-like [Balaenoptera ricei]|uniref:small integral membrane protein 20-like n=1 Tax=Balaenoptera ricei TaxID=2746895 RepID=UPI0028BEACAE|nr:small integral membrane protein 20-like [Balaenoptera ricei]
MTLNLRTTLIFGGFISLIGAAFYPIYFRPLMRLEEYRLEVWEEPVGEQEKKNPWQKPQHTKTLSGWRSTARDQY